MQTTITKVLDKFGSTDTPSVRNSLALQLLSLVRRPAAGDTPPTAAEHTCRAVLRALVTLVDALDTAPADENRRSYFIAITASMLRPDFDRGGIVSLGSAALRTEAGRVLGYCHAYVTGKLMLAATFSDDMMLQFCAKTLAVTAMGCGGALRCRHCVGTKFATVYFGMPGCGRTRAWVYFCAIAAICTLTHVRHHTYMETNECFMPRHRVKSLCVHNNKIPMDSCVCILLSV